MQYRSRICPDNGNILKFTDINYTENCVFINNCFNKDSFAVFAQNYNLCSNTHTYNTRYSHKGLLFVPTYNSISFRKKNQLFIPQPFLGIIYKVYFMTMIF